MYEALCGFNLPYIVVTRCSGSGSAFAQACTPFQELPPFGSPAPAPEAGRGGSRGSRSRPTVATTRHSPFLQRRCRKASSPDVQVWLGSCMDVHSVGIGSELAQSLGSESSHLSSSPISILSPMCPSYLPTSKCKHVLPCSRGIRQRIFNLSVTGMWKKKYNIIIGDSSDVKGEALVALSSMPS